MRRADHSSRGVLPSVVCLSAIVKSRQRGGSGTVGVVAPWKKIKEYSVCLQNATKIISALLMAGSDKHMRPGF